MQWALVCTNSCHETNYRGQVVWVPTAHAESDLVHTRRRPFTPGWGTEKYCKGGYVGSARGSTDCLVQVDLWLIGGYFDGNRRHN